MVSACVTRQLRIRQKGLPVDYVDPTEGNFSLTESAAVIDKGDKTNKLAMEMAECIIKNGRQELLTTYPLPIYEGETSNSKEPVRLSQGVSGKADRGLAEKASGAV